MPPVHTISFTPSGPPGRLQTITRQLAVTSIGRLTSSVSSVQTKIATLTCLLLLAGASARFFNTASLYNLLWELEQDPYNGLLVFIVLFVIGQILLLPGVLFALAAGALYGAVAGSLVIWTATVLGQTAAFLIGRYLMRDFVANSLAKRIPNFAILEIVMSRQGWKFVCLLRLSPIIPYSLLNYALAVTSIQFWPYTISSALTIVPYTCACAYLGSLSSSITSILEGKVNTPQMLQLEILWVCLSIVLLVVTCFYTTVISRQTFQQVMQEQELMDGESQEHDEVQLATTS